MKLVADVYVTTFSVLFAVLGVVCHDVATAALQSRLTQLKNKQAAKARGREIESERDTRRYTDWENRIYRGGGSTF